MADFKTINTQISVSAQISVEDVARAARLGFKGVICNRPDGEEPGQIPLVQIVRACDDHGLAFFHVPVSGGFSPDDIGKMRAALDAIHGPALAYCRSGTRSTNLWALAEASKGQDPDALITSAASAGYDLRGIAPVLQQLSHG